MNFWIITDTHFGHEAMHHYCDRPEGFEKLIFDNLRHFTNKDDVLIHLGDFCIGVDYIWHEQFMKVCHCKKWLIKGNHDSKTNSWYMKHGWDFVADEVRLKMYGKTVILTHRPIDVHGENTVNIHGHFHNTDHHPKEIRSAKNKLVYIEHAYRPIKLQYLAQGKI